MLTTKHLALWLMAQAYITAARQVSQVGVANIECCDRVTNIANIECLDRVTNIECLDKVTNIECLDRVTNIVFIVF